jgi:hypothetical protein
MLTKRGLKNFMANDSQDSKKNKNEDSEFFDVLNGGKSKLGDTIKKVFTAGISTAFMTEEGIKNYLSDLKLPKDILNVVLQNASKSKDEVTNRVTKEIINLVSKIDFVKEASRFMEDHKFRVVAEIEILKKKKSSDSEDSSDQETELKVKVHKNK